MSLGAPIGLHTVCLDLDRTQLSVNTTTMKHPSAFTLEICHPPDAHMRNRPLIAAISLTRSSNTIYLFLFFFVLY